MNYCEKIYLRLVYLFCCYVPEHEEKKIYTRYKPLEINYTRYAKTEFGPVDL